MRRFAAFITLLALCAAPHAEQAIRLSPAKGHDKVLVSESQNYVGSCGHAAVMLYGVTGFVDGLFTIEPDVAKVIVRRPPGKAFEPIRQLVLSPERGEPLSDYNGMACVLNGSKPRLVIWSDCGGSNSACGQGFSFVVIDPETVELLAPQDLAKQTCDASCAARLLGGKLPPGAVRK